MTTNAPTALNAHKAAGASLCALMMLLGACSTPEKPKPPPVQPVIQNPQRASLRASDENSGASVVLERSQEFIVSLPLVATSSSEWSIVDMKPGVLTLKSARFERSSRDVAADESPGVMVFLLKPEAAGSMTLQFDLRRPHSLQPATRTVTYAVTVR